MVHPTATIGREYLLGPYCVVGANASIGAEVLAGRSIVTSDLREAEHHAGYPLQPIKDAMRTLAALGQLSEIRKNVNRLMKQLPGRP